MHRQLSQARLAGAPWSLDQLNRLLARALLTSVPVLLGASIACAGRPSMSFERSWRSPPPSVTGIVPAVGSTVGYTPMTIHGTGFQSGAIVTVDGSILQGRFGRSNAVLSLQTPAHSAGPVDIRVTNPDGQTHRVIAAYTYAPPASFDVNGSWRSSSVSKGVVQLDIQNNALVEVSCNSGAFARIALSPPLPVIDGAFSLARSDGVTVSGRIVSASAAVGTINLAPCAATSWAATKRTASRRQKPG